MTCSGEITAHFTWKPDPSNPNEPPPASAVVQQDCMVQCYLSGGTGSTGSYATGLGQSGSGSGPYDTVYTRYGTKFTVQSNPGPSFSLSPGCSPSVSATVAPTGACGGLVEYSATAYNVLVGLGGATPNTDSSLNILIGQGCTGTLSASPATLSNYQWTIPGTVFNSFVVADDQSYGYVHNIFGDEYEKPNPHWHWSKDETVTVSCTAQASVNGQAIGTVTGQQQVKIWAPYYYFGNDTGGVFIDPYSPGNWLLQARNIPNTSPRGSNWQGRVTTPDLFSNNGYGAWHFVQIITPGRSKTLTGGGALNCTENGNVGLDTSYPYPVGRSSDPFLALLNGWSADDGLHVTGDSPRTGLDDTIAHANIDENFSVYMMYLPPNSDSQWVPLHKFQWRWYADDAIPGVSWTNWSSGSYAGYVARSSSQRCYDHPFWERLEGVSVGSGW